jgi:hypothetical protein
MATTTNYSWTTPDDTDLVKDGAAAIRTLGSSIDTSVKALSPGTTAGDVDYYTTSTAKARLGIGTAGQVLKVNSGATAPEWGSVSADANWSLLNAGGTSLTGSSVSITGISAKDKIMVFITGVSNTAGNRSVILRLNTDTGSNYGFFGIKNEPASSSFDQRYFGGAGDATSTSIPLAKSSTSATDTMFGYCLISGCNTSGVKIYNAAAGNQNSGANENNAIQRAIGGFYTSASTISSVQITTDGTFDAGTVFVYASA